MQAIKAVAKLKQEELWLSAGFIRNHVWDLNFKTGQHTKLDDIDVIYYNRENTDKSADQHLEKQLFEIAPHYPWSVKNQARMYIKNSDPPYKSLDEALQYWLETVTPIAVRMSTSNELEMRAPLGIQDMVNGTCRIAPLAKTRQDRIDAYRKRMKQKKWWTIWDGVTVNDLD